MRKVRVQDLVLQSVASIVNLTARRIAKEDERDLDQARAGIEAVRALVDQLEPDAQKQVRSALSELQMIYAQATGGGGGEGEPQEDEPERPPQERESPGSGLWTPPGT
jgi:hypothetical protein